MLATSSNLSTESVLALLISSRQISRIGPRCRVYVQKVRFLAGGFQVLILQLSKQQNAIVKCEFVITHAGAQIFLIGDGFYRALN